MAEAPKEASKKPRVCLKNRLFQNCITGLKKQHEKVPNKEQSKAQETVCSEVQAKKSTASTPETSAITGKISNQRRPSPGSANIPAPNGKKAGPKVSSKSSKNEPKEASIFNKATSGNKRNEIECSIESSKVQTIGNNFSNRVTDSSERLNMEKTDTNLTICVEKLKEQQISVRLEVQPRADLPPQPSLDMQPSSSKSSTGPANAPFLRAKGPDDDLDPILPSSKFLPRLLKPWHYPSINQWEYYFGERQNFYGNDNDFEDDEELALIFDDNWKPDPSKPPMDISDLMDRVSARQAEKQANNPPEEVITDDLGFLEKFKKCSSDSIKLKISKETIIYLSPTFLEKVQKTFPDCLLNKYFCKLTKEKFGTTLPIDKDGSYTFSAEIPLEHWGIVLNYIETGKITYFLKTAPDILDLAYSIDFLNIKLTTGGSKLLEDLIIIYIHGDRHTKNAIKYIIDALPAIFQYSDVIREIQVTGFVPDFSELNIAREVSDAAARAKLIPLNPYQIKLPQKRNTQATSSK